MTSARDRIIDLGIDGVRGATEIGRGGFAVVYRAEQPVLARTVAIKVATSRGANRFAAEGRSLGALSGHPNVVGLHGCGRTGAGEPYLLMDFHQRGSLSSEVVRSGPQHWAAAARIAIKIAGALESAHRLGVLHRDVKPHNVLLSDFGEPLLADFGVAESVQAPQPSTVGVSGSVPYAAPEVLDGGAGSVASDVYSLAATLFYLLAGRPPFEARGDEAFLALFLRVAEQPPPPLPDGLPPALCELVYAGLDKSAHGRPDTARAVGETLQCILAAAGLPGAQMVLAPEPAAGRDDSAGAGREGRRGARRIADPAGPAAAEGVAHEVDTLDDMQASRWRTVMRRVPGARRMRADR